MGTAVLDPQVSVAPNTYVYAQCLEGKARGVTLLVINADRQRSFDLNLPTAGERYTLTAKQLEDTTVELNGQPLRLVGARLTRPALIGSPLNCGRSPLLVSWHLPVARIKAPSSSQSKDHVGRAGPQ